MYSVNRTVHKMVNTPCQSICTSTIWKYIKTVMSTHLCFCFRLMKFKSVSIFMICYCWGTSICLETLCRWPYPFLSSFNVWECAAYGRCPPLRNPAFMTPSICMWFIKDVGVLPSHLLILFESSEGKVLYLKSSFLIFFAICAPWM